MVDRRGDDLAHSTKEPVDRRLTAAMVDISVVDPGSPAARQCVAAYMAELDRRFETGFDPDQTLPADAAELRPPKGAFMVATRHSEPIGCGGLKFHGRAPAELKRLWVAPGARGLGVGRRLLSALEDHAITHGSTAVRLDTNGSLVEAIALYRSTGYVEVDAFNNEPYAHHWFEKRLAPRRRARS